MTPPLLRTTQHLALALSLTGAVYVPSSAYASDDEKIQAASVNDLSELIYKSALFPFYQDDYFAGMTALRVAKEHGQLVSNIDQADLLLASLYLSYGMHDDAASIFLRLTDTLKDPQIINKVWLQLAEIHYKAQSYTKAKEALERITDKLPSSLRERKAFLHGNTLLALADYDAAVQFLTTTDKKNIWYYYGLFNVGIKLLGAEQTKAGYNALNHLANSTLPKTANANFSEIRALQDKSRLILGYHELKTNNPGQAIHYFSSIALNSPYSLWGLYGLGRSAYAEEDYKSALKYWLALEQHTNNDIPLIEARLATSQLYFRLGALQQSLDGFNETIELCKEEISAINATVARLSSDELSKPFLFQLLSEQNAKSDEDNTAFMLILNRPDFIEMLSSTAFNKLRQDYRDLTFYRKHLLSWQQSMAAFDQILQARKLAFETKLPVVMNRHESLQIDNLKQTHTALIQLANKAQQQEDPLSLANENEFRLLSKFQKIENKLAQLKSSLAPEQYQALLAKLSLLSGVMHWNLATDFKPRLRSINKGLQDLGKLLEETAQLDSALKLAKKNAPTEFANYDQKITDYTATISTLLISVDELTRTIENQTKEKIIDTLEIKKEALFKLQTHARFAVAQIYDLSVTNKTKSQ